MKVVERLLDNRVLVAAEMSRLAMTCKSLRMLFRKRLRSRFGWVAELNRLDVSVVPDLMRWRTMVSDFQFVLTMAGKMNHCARGGKRTLAWCCHSCYWSDNLNFDEAFDLESMIRSRSASERFHAGKSVCNHNYEYERWAHNVNPHQQFQHVFSCACGWTIINKAKNTKWSWSNGSDNWLSFAETAETCGCFHCKTFARPPSGDCDCPRCSDPIKGSLYWTNLTDER